MRGCHACGSLRVTVQPATGCLLAGGGDSPDLAGGPGPMPLTLASTSVPRAARISHGRGSLSPRRTHRPPRPTSSPRPGALPGGLQRQAAHPAAEAAARTAAAADRLRRRRRRTTATRPSSPSKSASGGPGESCGRSPDSCVTASMGTLQSRAGSPASPAASSGTAGTTPDAGQLSRGRLGRSRRARRRPAPGGSARIGPGRSPGCPVPGAQYRAAVPARNDPCHRPARSIVARP